ncbi:MAG: hypothetical protein WCZ17_00055 [Candidatus Kapaibacterium sp.]|jgi:hypothetical protein|nr:hypothetical protein [Candidatus Kapabacteria bacterium]
MRCIITILIIILLYSVRLTAEKGEDENKWRIKSIVFISGGLPFSTGSPDFFSVYNNEFSSQTKDIKLRPLFAGGTKLRFDNFRLGAQFHVYHFDLRDTYEEYNPTSTISNYRVYGQTMSISDIPIVLTAEYMPFVSQFRTYVGGGLGFLLRRTEWIETVRSDFPLDPRVGGLNYDDTDILPFLKFYSGLELGFDKHSEDTFLGSLMIEVSYNYSFGGVDMFNRVKKQFVPAEPRLDESYNIMPGYIAITLGLTFNFNRKQTIIKQ